MVYAANAIHYGWSPSNRSWIDDAAAWATGIALLVLYWAGYRVLRRSAEGFRPLQVLLPVAPLVLISFLTIPYDSTDAFLYVAVGQAEAHFGMNPYTTTLREVPASDPAIESWMRTSKNPWQDLPLVYGFGFAHLIRTAAWLGHGSWIWTLAILKVFNVLAYAGIGWIVWSIACELGAARPDLALYLFAWSPLILLHHIANAHNDILVGFLVVLAFHLVVFRRSLFAPACLAVAAMIKYISLPLIPLVLLDIARREGWRRAVVSGVLAVIPAALLSIPFAGSLERFRWDLIAAQLNKVTAGSLYSFFYYLFRFVGPAQWLPGFGALLKVLLWAATAAFALWQVYGLLRRKSGRIEDLVSTCAWILFAIIFVGSSQFYSWYIGMVFPLVLLLDAEHELRRLVVLLGGTHVFSLTSLSRKGIGYFVATTGVAVGVWLRNTRTTPEKSV